MSIARVPVWGWSTIALIIVAAVAWFVWQTWFDAYHLATVQPGVLYRDGVRTMREFQTTVRIAKPHTIVCLVDDSEIGHSPFVDELAYCRQNNIDVVRIPVMLGGWPQGDQIRQFLSIATDPTRQPVLVHCAQGVRRTGMMIAAYQESILGYDPAKAKASMLTFGHSQRTVGDIERFIDVYDPLGKMMTREFPRSAE
jgi:protein tyrosine/serine phosphatase